MSVSIVGEVLAQASAVAAVTVTSKSRLINGYQQAWQARELRYDLDYQLQAWARKCQPLMSLAFGNWMEQRLTSCRKQDQLTKEDEYSTPTEVNMFPHLHIKNTMSTTPTQIIPNTTAPMRLSTENFEGKAMLILQDTKSPSYDSNQPAFEIQIQGKFKKKPEGIIFIGAEVHKDQIAPGALGKAVTSTLSEIIYRLSPLLHQSTGCRKKMEGPQFSDTDTKVRELVEHPHMMYPLWKAADTFHITKQGEDPPQLGLGIKKETEEHYKSRIESNSFGEEEFNENDTYTFAFNSVFLDFVHWRVAQLPPVTGVGLELFFGKDPIQVCMYEVSHEHANKKHFSHTKTYHLSFELGNQLASSSDRVWKA